ncbi:MAG: VWA domain-containing protein [Catonella sp.]|uniref:VWA domain-containing protein n=1 Tax=Catonella sp. TaxID=2382125 RepID=UPI003F9F92EB
MVTKKKKRVFWAGLMLFIMLVNIFGGGGYSFGVRAKEPENTWDFQNNGVLVEQDDIKLKETALEDTYSQDPYGEFDVKLEVEGDVPIVKSEEKLDVVLAIDRSNSMSHHKRMAKAKAAAAAFVDKLLTDGEGNVRTDNKVKVGLVGFGGVNQEKTEPVLEFSPLSDNPSNLKDAVNGYDYYPAGLNSGATFTQAGLMKAYEILQDDNGHNKAIVLISDGEPTYAYDKQYKTVIGNGYDWFLKTIRTTTIAEAGKIKGNNVTIYSLGIGVDETGEGVLKQIATSDDYYSRVAGDAEKLQEELDKVADKIKPSIVNADIELTMNDMVEFKNAADLTEIKVEIKGPDGANQDALTAKADAIKKTVTWDSAAKTLSFGDITLDKGEVLNITYKAELVEAHRDGEWKALNETAVLYPEGKAKDSDKNLDFIIPEVKDIVTTSIIVNKKWEGTPKEGLKVGLFSKESFNSDVPTTSAVMPIAGKDNEEKIIFKNVKLKDDLGNTIEYVAREIDADGKILKGEAGESFILEGKKYNVSYDDDKFIITNTEDKVLTPPDGQTPGTPGSPTEPSKPENPEDKPKPEQPETPKKPEEGNPTEPTTPTDPGTPGQPFVPSTPYTPTEPSTPTEPTVPSTPVTPSIPSVNPPIDVPFTPDRIINEELIPEGDPVFDIVNEGDTPLGKAKVDKKEKTYTFIDDDKAPKGVAKIHDDNTLEVVKVFDDKTPQGRLPKTGGNNGNRLILLGVALFGLGLIIRRKIR